MSSHEFALTENFQPLIEFWKLRVLHFHIEIQNFEGEALEFTLRNGGDVVIRVPNKSTTTRENFPLVGTLYGRTISGTANISIDIW
jgi:hypothetical protein